MAGAPQMAAPAGPHSCTPWLFLCVGLGASGIITDFHTMAPVAASSDASTPRKVQQG